MSAIVDQMRTRIMTSPVFTGERFLGAILFENTIDRDVEGRPTADYLWNVKRVVPFLKVDKGLAAESRGVQLLRPMPELTALLDKGEANHIFGTKMRSFVQHANRAGIEGIVTQQFEAARQIIAAGLVPIVELCLRLQRGSSVRGWGLTSWGRGPAAGARGRRAFMSTTLLRRSSGGDLRPGTPARHRVLETTSESARRSAR